MSPPRKPSPPWSRPMLGTDLFIVAEREGEHTPQPCSKADVYPVAKRSRFRGMALGDQLEAATARVALACLLDSAFLMRDHKVLYSKRYSPCFSFGECYTAVLHRHRLAVWEHTDFEGFFRYQKSVAERAGFEPPIAFGRAPFVEPVVLVAMLNGRPQQSFLSTEPAQCAESSDKLCRACALNTRLRFSDDTQIGHPVFSGH